jgi:hypothetical protein
MSSCVVSGVIGEAEDQQILGYIYEPNKKKRESRADSSNGRVAELIESTTRALQVTSVMVVGSEKLYHSICVR